MVREARQLVVTNYHAWWFEGRRVWLREDAVAAVVGHLLEGKRKKVDVWSGAGEDAIEMGVVCKKPINDALVMCRMADGSERRVRVGRSEKYGLGMEVPMRPNTNGYWTVARPGPRYYGRW
jgi:hypothetical protein